MPSKRPKSKRGTCNCIGLVNEKMRESGQNQEVVASLRLRPGEVYAFAVIATEKVDPKRRSKDPRLIATFCPFCGVEYPRPPEPRT